MSYRLCRLDGHELVVALLPADIAKGPVVPGVLGDVADLVHWVVMHEHLRGAREGLQKRPHGLDENGKSDNLAPLKDAKACLVPFSNSVLRALYTVLAGKVGQTYFKHLCILWSQTQPTQREERLKGVPVYITQCSIGTMVNIQCIIQSHDVCAVLYVRLCQLSWTSLLLYVCTLLYKRCSDIQNQETMTFLYKKPRKT